MDTGDFFAPQRDGAPQLDAVGAGTGLVTMTIGDNDGGVVIDSYPCRQPSP